MPASIRKPYTWLALLFILIILGMTRAAGHAQSVQPLDRTKYLEGAQIYQQNCSMCHGTNGEGRIGATLSKDWPSIRPELTVRAIIETGVPGTLMPAWSIKNGGPLDYWQIDALVYYILSWQTAGAPAVIPLPTATLRPAISPVPGVEGDPDRGAILFDQNCAVCHGKEGEGRVGAPLAKDWPSIRPDLTVKTTIQNGIPNSVMPAWSVDKGGPLTESDINNLVAFILSWQNNPPAPDVGQVSEPEPAPSPFRGPAGVALFFALLGIILGFAVWMQNRKK